MAESSGRDSRTEEPEDSEDVPRSKKQRVVKSDVEEVKGENQDVDLPQLEGTVGYENEISFVSCTRDGETKKYAFNNTQSWNPHRGLGSTSYTRLFLRDETNNAWKPSTEKGTDTTPTGCSFHWLLCAIKNKPEPDNTSQYEATLRPVLAPGTRVSFLAPPVDRFLKHPETGHIACFRKPGSYSLILKSFEVPRGFDGVAVNVRRMLPPGALQYLGL
jgi:hypothetical protein